jgi:hypothetical protein
MGHRYSFSKWLTAVRRVVRVLNDAIVQNIIVIVTFEMPSIGSTNPEGSKRIYDPDDG